MFRVINLSKYNGHLYIHQGTRGYDKIVTECQETQQVIHKSMKLVATQSVAKCQK